MECLSLAQIAEGLACSAAGNTNRAESVRAASRQDSPPVERIELNSRKVDTGALFWAIRGTHHDGHDYVLEAWQRGAVGIVSDRSLPVPGPVLEVSDTRIALGDFANWYRRRQGAEIVAVTGSVGKTTARTAIAQVLRGSFRVVESPANFNNNIGVPVSLLQLQSGDEVGVIELGANSPGEIGRLAQIAAPDIAVITAIAPVHLAGFRNIEGVLNAKAEVFESMASSGVVLLNRDCPLTATMAHRVPCRVLFYGTDENAHFHARVRRTETSLELEFDNQTIALAHQGRHFIGAAMAAVAIGKIHGIPAAKIAERVAAINYPENRCEVVDLAEVTVIDDSYNASPLATVAALRFLLDVGRDRRCVAVLGEMLELGTASPRYHAEIVDRVVEFGLSRCLLVGEQYREVWQNRRAELESCGIAFRGEVALAADWIGEEVKRGDVVLIKGSRQTGMESLVNELRGSNAAAFAA